MDDYTRQRLSDFLDRTGKDATVDEIAPVFEDKIDLIEDRATEELDDRTKVDYAVGMMNADDIQANRTGSSGQEMEIEILSIGHRAVFEDWGQDDIDTVMAHAVIHGPLGDDGQDRAAKAILFNQETEMDLLEVQQKFEEGNTLTAIYEVEEAWNAGDGFYRAYSTDDTELIEEDIDALPADLDGKKEMLRKMFPDVELASLAEDGKGLSAFDPESGYTDDWGVDIKRFSGTIVDYYIPDDRSFGIYNVKDESIEAEDLEGTKVHAEDAQGVPALTVWADPDHHMDYGVGSIVDIYGVIETDNNGQIVMRAAGIMPVVPNPLDEGDEAEDSDVQKTEEAI